MTLYLTEAVSVRASHDKLATSSLMAQNNPLTMPLLRADDGKFIINN
jgi:hypothetical protein